VQLDDVDYDLPPEAIATEPAEPRDSARLLVDRGGADPDHRHVRDLPELLQPGDLLVVNDSRVIPARLRLHRHSGGNVEVLLIEPLDGTRHHWEALVRPGGKLRIGERLITGDGSELVEMRGRRAGGDTFEIAFVAEGDPLAVLERYGEMPLPPYLGRPQVAPERYQTVYARNPGSAAAPTAGLHFTDEVFGGLAARGVEVAKVELVVGLDTFRPLDDGDPLQHRIHTESYAVDAEVLERCRAATRVVAVGTTSVRALESAAAGQLAGRTSLYIHRGYTWQMVDVMMTNFHMPRTTLLMMIDAFTGPRWKRLYQHALDHRYRFLSFGDAMLLDRCIQ
jgi:S-adenosylmethionine:tRNA ribosyltransferase-isomerase